jgi:hypothetical protein
MYGVLDPDVRSRAYKRNCHNDVVYTDGRRKVYIRV